MSRETLEKSINWFLERDISGAETRLNLALFGGEPLMEADLVEEAIRLCRKRRPNCYKQVNISATTNGTIATPRIEKLLRDGHMSLVISVDGGTAATSHRPLVSGKSSYDLVARNLPKLVSWAVQSVARVTFHPQSLDLVGNVRHVLELGAPAIALCPVEEADWHGYEAALDDAYQALAEWMIAEIRQGRVPPLDITLGLLIQYHGTRRGAPRPARSCSVGTNLVSADPMGNVMPCHRFLYRPQDWLGTVDSTKLSPHREAFLHLSARDILGCEGCVAEPICGGGCRLVAMEGGYDLATGKHPNYCLTMRAHARAVRHIYDTLSAEGNYAFLRPPWSQNLSHLYTM